MTFFYQYQTISPLHSLLIRTAINSGCPQLDIHSTPASPLRKSAKMSINISAIITREQADKELEWLNSNWGKFQPEAQQISQVMVNGASDEKKKEKKT